MACFLNVIILKILQIKVQVVMWILFDIIHQVFVLMAVMKEMIFRIVLGLDTNQNQISPTIIGSEGQ
jgi:hypothetical protein